MAEPKAAEFTVGGLVFALIPFLKEGEIHIDYDELLKRAKKLRASGSKGCRFIRDHLEEIPAEFRWEFDLIFPSYRRPGFPSRLQAYFAEFFCGNSGTWVQAWRPLRSDYFDYGGHDRLVRRVRMKKGGNK
ncbi:MAG: hypothetical protein G01um101431_772 [Parcubacteria group bacterium Gr01-1014_31]|nr:MAG: hypothetical protein G01um101431_772 [Parcubacteria group bacterium Gr01-1014_31]